MLRCWIPIALTLLLGLALDCQPSCAQSPAKVPTVMLVGQQPDGHPPGTHEYMPGVRLLATWLEQTGLARPVVTQADGDWLEGPELIRGADGVFLFVSEGARWISADPRRYQALAEHAQQKKGLAALHWAIGTKQAQPIDAFKVLFGPCHGGPDRKYKFLTTDLRTIAPAHPITSGIEPFRTKGEFYYELKLPDAREGLVPLLEADIEGTWQPVSYAWTRPDGGRSFIFSGGHFHENWKLIQYRRLVVQGILWTVNAEIPAAGLELPLDEATLALPARAE